ncbi:MAG: hypothetical protein ACRD96_08105 [Bryobacteraceae bacterium]
MTDNLDRLHKEILGEIAAQGLAVFFSRPGALEDHPMVLWETEAHPDFREFLESAKTAGVRLLLVGHRRFEEEEIDEVVEQLASSTLSREDRRSVESDLRALRSHIGETCLVEVAFDLQGRFYVYEASSEWFDAFLNVSDLVGESALGEEDEDEGPLGGYFSKN